MSAEATAFAGQFWDRKTHPTRLQDWGKLKKHDPLHKHGDVCPNGVPVLPEKGNSNDDNDSEFNVMELCSECLCEPSNGQLRSQKCEHLPPPQPMHF